VIKSVNKSKGYQKMLRREVLAGQTLSNKNIAKFYGHFEDTENDHLVFEYVKGKYILVIF
jgi:serine/threonine protein kinase